MVRYEAPALVNSADDALVLRVGMERMSAVLKSTHRTQTDEILDWLLSGHTLTPLESRFPPFNCLSLSQRVRTAARGQYDGICWPIETEIVRTDSGKMVARYGLRVCPHIAYG